MLSSRWNGLQGSGQGGRGLGALEYLQIDQPAGPRSPALRELICYGL